METCQIKQRRNVDTEEGKTESQKKKNPDIYVSVKLCFFEIFVSAQFP